MNAPAFLIKQALQLGALKELIPALAAPAAIGGVGGYMATDGDMNVNNLLTILKGSLLGGALGAGAHVGGKNVGSRIATARSKGPMELEEFLNSGNRTAGAAAALGGYAGGQIAGSAHRNEPKKKQKKED